MLLLALPCLDIIASTPGTEKVPDTFSSPTGAAVASLRGKAPHLPAALFRSGESDDVSTILRASDGVLHRWRELAGLHHLNGSILSLCKVLSSRVPPLGIS